MRTGHFRIAMGGAGFFSALLLAPLLLSPGCGRSTPGGAPPAKTSLFHGEPPHGGTAVALGDGDYNLEVVRDPAAGTLSVYLLDDDMENFVRSPVPSITLTVAVEGKIHPLVLAAVANPATGETVGDTSLFQGRAGWLKTASDFTAILQGITIHGTAFNDIPFHFIPRAARD